MAIIMKTNFSSIDMILFVSIGFTLTMLAARFIHTHELTYYFYLWNLFLALIPLVCSRKLLNQKRLDFKAICYLAIWLLFFPNAPYLVTDLFHFSPGEGCPAWFDLILVSSASWNGIVVATISLLQVEKFLRKCFSNKKVHFILMFFILLCGYGVYLGRFPRFNSWDVMTNPAGLAYYIKNSIVHPHQNISAWAFTTMFSLLFGIIFFTIKGLNTQQEEIK